MLGQEDAKLRTAVAAIDDVDLSSVQLDDPPTLGQSEAQPPPRFAPRIERIEQVRPVLGRTAMIVKLSPNVGDIAAMAAAAVECGADALTLINTMPAMAIDVDTRRTRLSHGTGGLSGPAVHPVAVRMVHETYCAVARDAGVPIVGVGGVMEWRGAAEMILAGATAVGMGTALFVDPSLAVKVPRGLARWVERMGCASVGELVGQVRDP